MSGGSCTATLRTSPGCYFDDDAFLEATFTLARQSPTTVPDVEETFWGDVYPIADELLP